MSEEKEIESTPDPRRTIEGLRDTGYDFESAIADIVDNSIAAKASVVDIRIDRDLRGGIRVSIADNGEGMDKAGLINAMRYGSPERSDPASLGKYGLGLKTASTAYCRRLSVISRNKGTAAAHMATWDLDYVIEKGNWVHLMSDSPDEEAVEHLDKTAPKKPGTVVVWAKVDRLLGLYQDPAGSPAKKALAKKVQTLHEHLALVYQRLLDSKDKRARNVIITLNDENVKAWNPFQEGLSELLASESQSVETASGKKAEFTVRAFILPRREEFDSDELAKSAKLSSDKQGIYIYRENRLIHGSSWLGMFQKEPHGTLLRVEFSFDHKLDEAFHLDIKKSKIILNEELWQWLRDQFLPAPRREADRLYREGKRKDVTKKSKGAHDASNRNIKNKEAEIGGAEVNVSNPSTGEVTVINPQGTVKLIVSVGAAAKPGEVFIQPAEGLNDGLLFEPAIIDQHKAARINKNHPYYHKVYVPNLNSSVTVQGMDSLIWALCAAEYNTTSDQTKESFENMRFEVSRILRKLVESLPEPKTDSDAA